MDALAPDTYKKRFWAYFQASLILLPVSLTAIDGNESFSGFSISDPGFETPSSVVEEPDQVSDTIARYHLAKILLYKDETLKEAAAHLKILVQTDPDNVQVGLLYVRYLMRIQNYTEMNVWIDKLMHRDLTDPYDLIDLAGMQAEVGHAVISRDIFEKARPAKVAKRTQNEGSICIENVTSIAVRHKKLAETDKEPADLAILEIAEPKPSSDDVIYDFWEQQYAIAAELWGDWAHSESILKPRTLLPEASAADKLNLGTLYVRSHKYAEAEQLYIILMDEHPESTAYFELISLKIQLRDFDAAVSLIDEATDEQQKNPLYGIIKAEYLFQSHQYAEAEQAYIALAAASDYDIRQSTYLSRAGEAALRQCEIESAYEHFSKAHQLNPFAVRPRYYLPVLEGSFGLVWENILELSSQEINEWANALIEDTCIDMATALLEATLEKDPAFFRGEWTLANLYATRFRYDAALEIYSTLQATFPDSQMVLLQLARAYSWAKFYGIAICMYDELHSQDPTNSLFVFEKAHVALWSQNATLAYITYLSLLDPCWEEVPTIETYVTWHTHMTAWLEMQAKFSAWQNWALQGLDAYEEYLAFRPNNSVALFEYAQLYQILGVCSKAAQIYEQMLEYDPNHNIAQKAMERIAYEESPKISDHYQVWSEQGYGTLSAITRHRVMWKVQQSCDCQTQAAVYQVLFADHPFINGGSFVANGLGFEYKRVVNERLAFKGAYTRKVGASYHLHHHNLGLAEVNYRFDDRWLGTVGYDRTDEFYNYFGIKQGVQSDAYWARLAWNTTRSLRIEGMYRYLRYTDHNFLNNGVISFNYQFTDFPKVWRASLQGEYRNTAETDLQIFIGPQLVDIIHPYWCPQDYFAGRLILEYYNDMSELNFAGSEKHYYLLRFMVGDDTDDNVCTSGGFEWHYDWDNRWSAQVSGLLHYSQMWKAAGLWSQISYAF